MGNTKQSEQFATSSSQVAVSKEEYDALKSLEYECTGLKQQVHTLQTLLSDKENQIKDILSLIPGLIKGTTPATTPSQSIASTPVFFGNNFQNPQFVEDNLTKKPDIEPKGAYEELLKKAIAQAKSTK